MAKKTKIVFLRLLPTFSIRISKFKNKKLKSMNNEVGRFQVGNFVRSRDEFSQKYQKINLYTRNVENLSNGRSQRGGKKKIIINCYFFFCTLSFAFMSFSANYMEASAIKQTSRLMHWKKFPGNLESGSRFYCFFFPPFFTCFSFSISLSNFIFTI